MILEIQSFTWEEMRPRNLATRASALKELWKPTSLRRNFRESTMEMDMLPWTITCMKMS